MRTWIALSVGFVSDPTTIVVVAEQPGGGEIELEILLRTQAHMSPLTLRESLVNVIGFYRAEVLSFDSTGMGLPVFQWLQRDVGLKPAEIDEQAAKAALAAAIPGYDPTRDSLFEITTPTPSFASTAVSGVLVPADGCLP